MISTDDRTESVLEVIRLRMKVDPGSLALLGSRVSLHFLKFDCIFSSSATSRLHLCNERETCRAGPAGSSRSSWSLQYGLRAWINCRFLRLPCAIWSAIRNASGGVRTHLRSTPASPVGTQTPRRSGFLTVPLTSQHRSIQKDERIGS
jgi:hypothetical protein